MDAVSCIGGGCNKLVQNAYCSIQIPNTIKRYISLNRNQTKTETSNPWFELIFVTFIHANTHCSTVFDLMAIVSIVRGGLSVFKEQKCMFSINCKSNSVKQLPVHVFLIIISD